MTPARNPSAKIKIISRIEKIKRNNNIKRRKRKEKFEKQLPIFSQRSRKSLNSSIRSECFPSKSVT